MNARILATACAVAMLCSCSKSSKTIQPPPAKGPEGLAVAIGGKSIPVDLWATERERRSLLYAVPRIDEGRGLLLAWPRERHLKIESQSSAASYDVAFLDRSGKVVEAGRLKQEDAEGIMSRAEAAYALLVAPKTVDFKVGDSGTFSAPNRPFSGAQRSNVDQPSQAPTNDVQRLCARLCRAA